MDDVLSSMPLLIVGKQSPSSPWRYVTCRTHGCQFQDRRIHVYPDKFGVVAFVWPTTACMGCGMAHRLVEEHPAPHWRAVISHPTR